MIKTMARVAVAAAFAVPVGAQAVVIQFNANLNAANELHMPASSATGVGTLFYDDKGTVSLADDTYDVALSVFGLTGVATAFHIHGAATVLETAPVRVALDAAPFVSFISGGTLLVGGDSVPAPVSIPATAPSATNAGHPSMSFLAMLQGQLAYFNVHTAMFGSGEVRGQLIEVAVIPEPETYALMLAGLGLVGWAAGRRRKAGV